MTNKSARQFKRFFNSGAVKCETDAQGRVIIPQTLRTFANIEKDVVIIRINIQTIVQTFCDHEGAAEFLSKLGWHDKEDIRVCLWKECE